MQQHCWYSAVAHTTVENGTICIDLDKVAAVQTWLVPTCVKEIQSFLGFANDYNEYIKSFAKLVAPKMTWWLEQHKQRAFDVLK